MAQRDDTPSPLNPPSASRVGAARHVLGTPWVNLWDEVDEPMPVGGHDLAETTRYQQTGRHLAILMCSDGGVPWPVSIVPSM